MFPWVGIAGFVRRLLAQSDSRLNHEFRLLGWTCASRLPRTAPGPPVRPGRGGPRMQALRSAAVLATALFLVVACGGSPAVSTNPVAKSNPPVAASSTPAAPTATATPVAPGSVATPASVGTSPDAANICSLVTPAELASATGKTYFCRHRGHRRPVPTGTPNRESGASSGNLIIAAIQTQDLAARNRSTERAARMSPFQVMRRSTTPDKASTACGLTSAAGSFLCCPSLAPEIWTRATRMLC